SPAGTSIILSNNHGGNKSGFTDTIFDDEADMPIGAGQAHFAGAFKPDDPLESFTGQDALGTWKVIVQNSSTVNGRGALNSWPLTVTPNSTLPGQPPPAPGQPPNPPPAGNQPPWAGDDNCQTSSDTALLIDTSDLLANHYDPD